MTNDAFENAPTRPADDAGHGDSPRESAGFFDSTDLLISRVVDGVATAADWASLEEAAAANPSLWRDLAGAQREQALLTRELGERIRCAERVQLPSAAQRSGDAARRSAVSAARPAGWTGWLVAAAVALAGAIGWLRPHMSPPAAPSTGTVQSAGWSVNNTDEAVEAYLTLGRQQDRVLGEVPQRILLESRPLDDGQRFEVVYIRRFVERAKVDDLVRFTGAEDEAGRPVAMPVSTFNPISTEEDLPWSG